MVGINDILGFYFGNCGAHCFFTQFQDKVVTQSFTKAREGSQRDYATIKQINNNQFLVFRFLLAIANGLKSIHNCTQYSRSASESKPSGVTKT